MTKPRLSGDLTRKNPMIKRANEGFDAWPGGFSERGHMVGTSASRTQQRGMASVGLIAARTVVALRRLQRGLKPDDVDRAVLTNAADTLRQHARVFRYVEGNKRNKLAPGPFASAAHVASALRDSLQEAKGSDELRDSAAAKEIADQLDQLVRDGMNVESQAALARKLESVFQVMAITTRATAGSSGDTVSRRRPGQRST